MADKIIDTRDKVECTVTEKGEARFKGTHSERQWQKGAKIKCHPNVAEKFKKQGWVGEAKELPKKALYENMPEKKSKAEA